ncbi:hypothetical protein TVAG_333710 [Trichomonas vaginalis G3]|uniref:Uncharacterized protein n=1 Tax=Trichomonas vaginalis (strain ATCC PRA-98 / G3) TaxID=412133 RepID=A2F8S7_TRIV3|nr:hypothetical protein TVAGG3_1032390 [Trichomonas vaginalis G3]EAX98707.1 hypothetical protein TVAG_333710 [Trichomonas vaginalis G3]KAI5492961.1 hypothetical protein TVAGG3_1032390 [Trichomonas vaginalis G3]|eukprot:XP_001311637.1 hypothetical protein [Trichomonas vaginalis G3]
MLRFSDSEDENSGIVIAKRPRFVRTPPAKHQRNTRMRRSNSISEKKNANPVIIDSNTGCSDDELKNEQSSSSESVHDCFVIEFSDSSTTDSIKGEFHYTSNMIHQIEAHNFKHLVHSNYQIDISEPKYSSQPCCGSFFLVREKRFHLRSMRKYVLQTSEKILMSAKDHGFLNPDIYINEGDDVHIKAKDYKYKITPGESKSDFLVYDHNESIGSLTLGQVSGASRRVAPSSPEDV